MRLGVAGRAPSRVVRRQQWVMQGQSLGNAPSGAVNPKFSRRSGPGELLWKAHRLSFTSSCRTRGQPPHAPSDYETCTEAGQEWQLEALSQCCRSYLHDTPTANAQPRIAGQKMKPTQILALLIAASSPVDAWSRDCVDSSFVTQLKILKH